MISNLSRFEWNKLSDLRKKWITWRKHYSHWLYSVWSSLYAMSPFLSDVRRKIPLRWWRTELILEPWNVPFTCNCTQHKDLTTMHNFLSELCYRSQRWKHRAIQHPQLWTAAGHCRKKTRCFKCILSWTTQWFRLPAMVQNRAESHLQLIFH